MLINQTVDKLHSLRLSGMAEALTDQLQHPDRYGELGRVCGILIFGCGRSSSCMIAMI
jgi:hypothetical protein